MTDWVSEFAGAKANLDAALRDVGRAGQRYRIVLIRCARELGGVTAASRHLGISRQAIHRAIQKTR